MRSTLGKRRLFREFGSRVADDYLVIHSAFERGIENPMQWRRVRADKPPALPLRRPPTAQGNPERS
jgi:hypothetical protein